MLYFHLFVHMWWYFGGAGFPSIFFCSGNAIRIKLDESNDSFNSMNVTTQTERLGLGNRVGKKAAYLQELEEQVRNIFSFSLNSIWNFFLQFRRGYFSLVFSSVSVHWLLDSIKFVGLQNLIHRNEQLYSSGNSPSGGVALPFILVQVSFLFGFVTIDATETNFTIHDTTCTWGFHGVWFMAGWRQQGMPLLKVT